MSAKRSTSLVEAVGADFLDVGGREEERLMVEMVGLEGAGESSSRPSNWARSSSSVGAVFLDILSVIVWRLVWEEWKVGCM